MAENSAIEWTHHTFNPWWGCVKVSEACRNCYAATFAQRFGVEWGPQARRRFASEKVWAEPVKWNRAAEKSGERKRVFCASMADVFEWLNPDHPDAEQMYYSRRRLFRLIEETPHLDWLLLTKRPENVLGLGADPSTGVPMRWQTKGFPNNVWVGSTVEGEREADTRISELLKVPAKVLFLSMEPLLAPVELEQVRANDLAPHFPEHRIDVLRGGTWNLGHGFTNHSDLPGRINWVICGGESGPGARPIHPDWATNLRDVCVSAEVPFFFKQWGDWIPRAQLPAGWSMPMGASGPTLHTHLWSEAANDYAVRIGKKAAGRLLDGVEWNQFPTP